MKEKTSNPKKKESGIDMLARMMKNGFDRMDDGFAMVDKRFDKVENRLDGVESRLDGVEGRLDGVESRLGSLEIEQRETNRRLDAIDRKQAGVLSSLDETVTRKEFQVLASKVAILEKSR